MIDSVCSDRTGKAQKRFSSLISLPPSSQITAHFLAWCCRLSFPHHNCEQLEVKFRRDQDAHICFSLGIILHCSAQIVRDFLSDCHHLMALPGMNGSGIYRYHIAQVKLSEKRQRFQLLRGARAGASLSFLALPSHMSTHPHI